MKKFATLLIVLVFTMMSPGTAYAVTRSSSSRSTPTSRPSSRPSPPPSRPAPTPVKPSTPPPTPQPTAQATQSKPVPKPKWEQNRKYGVTKSQKTGKRPLMSRTPKPEPHTYNGRTYRSSDAIYTNSSGHWVMYFVLGAIVGGVLVEGAGDDPHCFDENHNEVTCNRDDNSFMKDW